MSDPRIPSASKDVVVVDRFIPAPPTDIFAILQDPARHHEIDGSGTVRDASTPAQQMSLGSTFGMAMHWVVDYEMVNTIVEFEQDAVIAWQPRPSNPVGKLFVGGRIWKYVLVPVEGGTRVTEIWDIRHERIPYVTRGMAPRSRDGMTKTLERIEKVLTA